MGLHFNRFSINSHRWKNAISTGNFYRIRFCLINVLNNRVYGIYSNVITVHNENTHRLWGYGSVGQLLNIVLVTLRRAGY